VGTSVTVTFELLDNDKPGLIAYLWKETPFAESPMTNVSGKIFSTTLNGQTIGATISYACKFAYSGGLAVTKYFSYQVGKDCSGSGNDTEKPTNFTATVGAATAGSIELILQASDNSGDVIYTVKYGTTTLGVSAASGVQKSFLVTGLTPSTNYTFAVTASDLTGNTAANNPITLNAATTANLNTECSGSLSESSDGSPFSVGYKYGFVTTGTSVKITFELLDAKDGVIAFLWKQTPFAETAMTLVSGKIFTSTITGQSVGSTITYACKFAYAGGMSVTKYLSYVVGNTCPVTGLETSPELKQSFFPNPVQTELHLQLLDAKNRIILTDIPGHILLDKVVPATYSLDMGSYKTGIYLLRIENKHGVQFEKIIKN
jgi:hypothetical protein